MIYYYYYNERRDFTLERNSLNEVDINHWLFDMMLGYIKFKKPLPVSTYIPNKSRSVDKKLPISNDNKDKILDKILDKVNNIVKDVIYRKDGTTNFDELVDIIEDYKNGIIDATGALKLLENIDRDIIDNLNKIKAELVDNLKPQEDSKTPPSSVVMSADPKIPTKPEFKYMKTTPKIELNIPK